jgi:hypothetical protein
MVWLTATYAKEIDLSYHSGGEALTLYGAEGDWGEKQPLNREARDGISAANERATQQTFPPSKVTEQPLGSYHEGIHTPLGLVGQVKTYCFQGSCPPADDQIAGRRTQGIAIRYG